MATLSNIDEMKRVARGYPPLTPQQQFDQQRALRKQSNAGSAAHQLMDLQASKAAGSSPTGQPPAGSTYYGKPREGSTGIIAEGVTEGANKAPDTLRGRPRPGGTTAGTTGGTAAAPGGSTSSPVEAAATVDPATGETTTESESGFTQVSGILGEVAPGQTIESPRIYQPQPYEASQDELVAGQLSRLLGENSPYLQQARTQAQQAAHARGLSNSAMAAGWGQEAAIKSALPIAQQDAGYFQNRGLEDQKGIIASNLQQQQDANAYQMQQQNAYNEAQMLEADLISQWETMKYEMSAEDARQAKALTAEMERLNLELEHADTQQAADIAAKKELLVMDLDAQLQRQREAAEANMKLQESADAALLERTLESIMAQSNGGRPTQKGGGGGSNVNMDALKMELASKEKIAAMELDWKAAAQEAELAANERLAMYDFDRQTQVQLTDSLGTLAQQYQRESAGILTNPDFDSVTDRNTALKSAADAYKDNAALLASLTGVNLDWGGASGSGDFGVQYPYTAEAVSPPVQTPYNPNTKVSGKRGGLNRT